MKRSWMDGDSNGDSKLERRRMHLPLRRTRIIAADVGSGAIGGWPTGSKIAVVLTAVGLANRAGGSRRLLWLSHRIFNLGFQMHRRARLRRRWCVFTKDALVIQLSRSRTRSVVLSLAAQLHGAHALAPSPFHSL